MSELTGDSAVQRSILTAVEALRAEVTATLQQLVRIPSQTGCEGEAQSAVAEIMRHHGLGVDVWEPNPEELAPFAEHVTPRGDFAGRPNVVGVFPGRGQGRSLILNGHIDTVETGDRAAWSHEPLGGDVHEGRLFGRGSCDMKAGIVANLFALRALREAGYEPEGDVFVQSTISEEDGGAGALAAILRGYRADAAIISEPTDLSIVTAQGGSLMFRLRVPGLSAHACVRNEGVSAIENFSYLHRGILDFEARRNREVDHPLYREMANKVPINIGVIRGGSWPSSVPELVEAEGRAGLVPGEDFEAFKGRMAQEVQELARADPWLAAHPPTIDWLDGQFAPAGVADDSPLPRSLARAIEMATGAPARVAGVTYGADMRHFVNTGGMPCVMFGAGDVRLAHAPDESVPLDDLMLAISVSALFIASWCGVRPS